MQHSDISPCIPGVTRTSGRDGNQCRRLVAPGFPRFILWFALVAVICLVPAFSQSDRGTLTGTVTDPTGAVVMGAEVVAVNSQSGAVHKTVTTGTGNFTLPSLPAGGYEVSIEASGFKRYVQKGITIQVAQTARLDATLALGTSAESITITADATLLKTESAEQSTTVNGNSINSLPINFGGGGQGVGAIRDPLAFIALSPGVAGSGTTASLNGLPAASFRILYEGQDLTSSNSPTYYTAQTQGSVEMIDEFTLQSTNMSAEFGQMAGGLINFTTKSGTNQLHGSAYEYFVNEAFDAALPFTHVKPLSRKHDWGFTVGGPVMIPKLYNGRDKTFFFFNFEKFDNNATNSSVGTMPTAAMRGGDFSQTLTGKTLGTDVLGRPILENGIYDPASSRTVNGQMVRDMFPNNIVPITRLDPVAVKIQALMPQPTIAGLLTNNWYYNAPNSKHQYIPGVKIDHQLTPLARLSAYYSSEHSDLYSSADGLPAPITSIRVQNIYSHTMRLNYDHPLTPTLLVHAGVGYLRFQSPDSSPSSVLEDYDAVAGIGFKGGAVRGFPRLAGLNHSLGGVVDITNGFGPTNANKYFNDKFTSVLSATKVSGSHTYKAGAEMRIDMWTDRNSRGATGVLNFTNLTTAQIVNQTATIGGGSSGFPYASFLLGQIDNATVNPIQDPQLRRKAWGLFVQDNWKVTRNLTLDYGLRWDLQSQGHEIFYRTSMFGPSTPNPSAGNLPGGVIYEGKGPGRVGGQFTKTYPYGVAPRLGIAYRINPKTAARAAFGVVYGTLPPFNWITNQAILGVGWNQLAFTDPVVGQAAATLAGGLMYNPADLTSVTLDPGIVPYPGKINSPNYFLDPNGGRPPRVYQWNISLQRELTQDLSVELAYVGNRSIWITATNLINLNATNPQRLADLGFDLTSTADRAILTSTFASGVPQQHGFNVPYAGFPVTQTLAQSLRPFPQFGSISAYWSPLGNSWYDSLQAKVVKRMSNGLSLTAAFTWSKAQTTAGGANNVFNREVQKSIANFDRPLILSTSFTYEIPRLTSNKIVNGIFTNWAISGMLVYSSGAPIASPASNNNLNALLFQNTRMNRVPGQPLYLKNINDGSIDPNKEFVLNPAAWTDVPAGTWGAAPAYYSDFRYARRPSEQLSLGRTFRLKERYMFQIRGEFFNPFNRNFLNNPVVTNPAQTQVIRNGVPVSGFGYINSAVVGGNPRNGQIVARFQF